MASSAVEHRTSDAWAYERHIRENWDQLTPYQQEEARAYLQARFQGAGQPARATTPANWPVPTGYVCAALSILILPILLAPVALGCGIYNAAKGRTGHGVAQIVLAIVCGFIGFVLGAIVWAV